MWRVTPHTSPSEVSRINVNKNFSHVPPKVILKTQYCVTKNFSDALILIIYAKRIQYTVMPCVVNLFPSIPYKGLQKILRGKEECYCHLIWDNSVLTKCQVGKQSQPIKKLAPKVTWTWSAETTDNTSTIWAIMCTHATASVITLFIYYKLIVHALEHNIAR